jgi:PKD repeat protein
MKPGRPIPILVLLCLIIPLAGAQDLVITQPSANELQLAEMRDFYVYGIFPETVAKPGNVLIEVFPGDSASGTPVRVVRSVVDPVTGITNESMINTAYANATRMNNVMVPDLVQSPGTFLDTSNKLVVTNTYYMGLILGGVTRDFDTSYTGPNGTPLADMTAGNYTIRVTGLSGDLAGQVAEETVTFGLTDAVLGSFKNIPNKNALIQYAAANNRRVYLDWFPGYFTDPYNSSKWYEAPCRWKPNNGIEVVNDRPGTLVDTVPVADNRMFVYNINNGSTTYKIELSAILRYHLVDSPRTMFLSYDIGEPSITWNDASTGNVQTVPGTPVPFPSSDRMHVARVEILNQTNTSYENLFDPNDVTTPKILDFDLSDGVSYPAGREFVVYGAVKPIASTVTSTGTPYEFTINNRITHIVSVIRDSEGRVVSTTRHDVNLSRLYNSGSPQRFNSLWEFGIEVTGLAPGVYTMGLAGTDAYGATMPGATAAFPVTVLHAADFTGSPVVGNAPLTVQFTDLSTQPVTSWAWDFTNDGTTDSTLQNPIYTYTNPGTWSVRLNITGPGGSDSRIRTNYVTVRPGPNSTLNADFTVSPVTGMAPFMVKCTDNSSGSPSFFSYNFGDGSNITGPNPVHTYKIPGVYDITLTITKFDRTTGSLVSNSLTKKKIVTVTGASFTPPVAKFTATPVAGIAPLTVRFTDQSTGYPVFYNYNFGDGTNVTGPDPDHTYRSPGTYTVTLTVMKQDATNGTLVADSFTQKDLIVVHYR